MAPMGVGEMHVEMTQKVTAGDFLIRTVPIGPPWCRTDRAHSQRRRAAFRATVRLAYHRTHARSAIAPLPNVFERARNARHRPWSGAKSYCADLKDPARSRSGRLVRA